jgi:hypothetical protein
MVTGTTVANVATVDAQHKAMGFTHLRRAELHRGHGHAQSARFPFWLQP